MSITEFADQHVVHETQYFADPVGAPDWRTALAEPMPGRPVARLQPEPANSPNTA